jgi:CRP/FNR family transcriptional regulator, cyclic AMP receptor protein
MSQLLAGLADEERARAQRVLEGCVSVELAAGAQVSAAEVPAAVLLLVQRGVALLIAGAEHAPRRIVLALAGPGGALLAPSDDELLRGLTPARLTAVSADAERELLREPSAAKEITLAVLEALADREESLANFARFPHAERVRGKLLQLARWHGRVTEDGIVIDLPLTHDLIAESVGSTRETVTLALRELTRVGFLSRAERRFRVHLPAAEVAAGSRLPVRNPTARRDAP